MTMNPRFANLRNRATNAKRAADNAQRELDDAIRQCRHVYDEPKWDPIIHPGGYSEGDPPGTMGVDWRGPMSWPETREPRWSRTCKECGHVDYTTQSYNEPATKKPRFHGDR